MTNDIEEAKDIISNNIYMTIATSTPDGTPWISPVFFAYDKNHNLYWTSYKNSKHSQLVRNNSRVAIVVFDSHAPEGEGDGVYFEAEAKELVDLDEIEAAMKLLGDRVTQDEFRITKINEVSNDGMWRVYQAIPKHISKLTDGDTINGQYIDKRIDIDLTS